MKNKRLADELRRLVGRHGFEAVDLELRLLETKQQPTRNVGRGAQTVRKRRNGRLKAPEYVEKMDIDAERRPAVSALAERFEAKSFLPRCADISNFCAIYDIDEPASKSRAAAIPRLFKHLATMDTKEIKDLLADSAFAGPSQLAPLAEAIRRHGRGARSTRTKDARLPAEQPISP